MQVISTASNEKKNRGGNWGLVLFLLMVFRKGGTRGLKLSYDCSGAEAEGLDQALCLVPQVCTTARSQAPATRL